MTIAYVCAHTLAKSASRQFAESTCWPRTSGDAGAFAGINPTITSGRPWFAPINGCSGVLANSARLVFRCCKAPVVAS